MVRMIHTEGSFQVNAIVERLNAMKNTLAKGEISNKGRLDKELGDQFDAFKSYHENLQA